MNYIIFLGESESLRILEAIKEKVDGVELWVK